MSNVPEPSAPAEPGEPRKWPLAEYAEKRRFCAIDHPSAQEIHNRIVVAAPDSDECLIYYVRRIDMLHLVDAIADERALAAAQHQQEVEECERVRLAHVEQIKGLEALSEQHRSQIRRTQTVIERKNKELDALHFVWCSGTCGKPLTKDIVDEAIRNTERLITKFNGQSGNRAWRRLSDYPEQQDALVSAWKNFNAERKSLTADLTTLRQQLEIALQVYGRHKVDCTIGKDTVVDGQPGHAPCSCGFAALSTTREP